MAAAFAALALTAGCAPTVTGQQFAGMEKALVQQGFFRLDRDPADAPFTSAMLAENFDRIAFGRESDASAFGDRIAQLQRWEEPLRWWVSVGGHEAGPALRDVERTFERLSRATGLDIEPAPDDRSSNVDILFLGPDDYWRARNWVRTMLGAGAIWIIEDFRTDPGVLCSVRPWIRVEPGDGLPVQSISYALVLIRKGYSDDYRLSCVEEELAQMLGLGNDDPRVRPSAFNDDEEFVLLTVHDEMLLRILYDPRLSTGMTASEARPLVAHIAGELLPGR